MSPDQTSLPLRPKEVRHIDRPLGALADYAKAVAKGSIDQERNAAKRLARHLQHAVDSLAARDETIEGLKRALSETTAELAALKRGAMSLAKGMARS